MAYWPCPYETIEINTEFGICHVIVSGPEDGEAIRKLTAPVLFLVGDEERIYDAATAMARVSETIQHSEVMQIRGAGYCLILEQKSLFNKEIRTFIKKSLQ